MKTIKQLQIELGLSDQQVKKISQYLNELVVELLDGLKQDTIDNFEETIEALKKTNWLAPFLE